MDVFAPGILAGHVALVTGGGSGIGAGIAKRFAEQGAKVGLLGRKLDKLQAVAREIAAMGGSAEPLVADVRYYEEVEAAVGKLLADYGRLDIVVNSAAGNFIAPAAGLSANGFKAVVDIDLLGTFNTSRAAFEALARQGGSIVSITATQAWVPTPAQCHAGAAKAGIAKLTMDLALEWGPMKIRVNAVAPGPIADTEGMRRLAPADAQARERFERSMPLGRWGSVREVADAVLFLVSPAGAFVTGTTLVVDGGQSLIGSSSFAELLRG